MMMMIIIIIIIIITDAYKSSRFCHNVANYEYFITQNSPTFHIAATITIKS
jgi:hypothetical protein